MRSFIVHCVRRHTPKSRFLMGLLALFFVLPSFVSKAEARPKYTPQQVQRLIQQARTKKIRDAVNSNRQLRQYIARKNRLIARLRKGTCKKKRNIITRRYDLHCVKLYRGKEAVFINGKYKPVLSAGHVALGGLKKAFRKLKSFVEREVRKFDGTIRKLRGQITNLTRARFDKRIKDLKRKATIEAKKFYKSRAGKISKKILMLAKKKIQKAKNFMKPKMKAKLLKLLKSGKSKSQIKRLMYTEKSAAGLTKAFAKAAAFAALRIIAFEALKVTYNCWKYTGEPKRTCLRNELTTSTRDASFKILAKFVAIVLDLTVIEPMSHSASASVAATLAAATAGIGAVSYPIVYVACSVTGNLIIWDLFTRVMRPHYNRLFSMIAADVRQFVGSLVRHIPASILKCVGGPKVCGKLCPHGNYKDKRNTCWACPAGFAHDKRNKLRCSKKAWMKARYHGSGKLLPTSCPRGTFFDPIRGGTCWSCPRGTKRTVYPVTSTKACTSGSNTVQLQHLRATYHKKSGCPRGTFFDLIRGGTCWSCPRGTKRTVFSVASAKACVSGSIFKARYRRATHHKKSGCARGTFFDLIRGGTCWSCPRGAKRTVAAVTSTKACVRSVRRNTLRYARASFRKKGGCARGTFFDPIRGGTCWSCPRGAKRTIFPVHQSKACEGMVWKNARRNGVAR